MQAKKYYLCVRQNGIVRITPKTPAYFAGVFFEHIKTCVAICLRTPDNQRMTFIHMDAAMSCDSIAKEVELLQNENWEMITFKNVQAIEDLQTRYKDDLLQTEQLLQKYLKLKKWTSHWKKNENTTTMVAIIDRNFQFTTEIKTPRNYLYFQNSKLAECIDTMNTCYEGTCTGGLYVEHKYPAQLDYDGITPLKPPNNVQELPALERRVLQLFAALIKWLPIKELNQFKNARENNLGTQKIAEFLPTLLPKLFELPENEYTVLSMPTFILSIALILEEYVKNPSGKTAKQINDYLKSKQELNDTEPAIEKANNSPKF